MTSSTTARTLARLTLLVTVGLLAGRPAWADAFRVDMIVFLDLATPVESPHKVQAPDNAGISLLNTAALSAAGIRILPDSDFLLDNEWQHLRNSRDFRPLLRLAWIQNNPPQDNGPALQLRYGSALDVYDASSLSSVSVPPVWGTVSLLLNRFLHLDVDLHYTAAQGDGFVQYPLQEDRRMRSKTLHHLDSPKLGVLAQVTPQP